MAANRRKQDRYRRLRRDSGKDRRIKGAMAVLGVLAFVPVALRLGYLTVARYDTFQALALRNQSRTTQVSAHRGTVYDRNMNILAASHTVETVYIAPRELQQSKADTVAMSQALSRLLDVDAEAVAEKAVDRSLRYHRIKADVSKEEAQAVRAYIAESGIRGIHLEPGSKRSYPYGSLASQVIGFTNASNQGSEGIEAAYESYLSGKNGRVITTKGNNEMDMPYSVERYLESGTGADVILTLDVTVQACLEERMKQAIAAYDVRNGAFGLVMDVDTGEILAMATLGGYDPNQYLEIADSQTSRELERLRQQYLTLNPEDPDYAARKEAWQKALTAARLKQWRNRCLSDGYEPGSTFKTITLASALDSGAVTLNDHFACSGSAHIPGRSQLLHCWRAKGHGSQTTAQALQNSCNLAFANIGLRLGGERFYEYVKAFGILEKTGIDLAGEAKGVFFSKELITDTQRWGTASLTSGSFGQTFKVTPLQLVRAVAAVVNGGYLLEPYLVSEVVDSRGNTLLRQEPTVLRQVISEQTSAAMCTLMESVVTEGTAKNAAVAGYRVGGKTGTSEKIDVFDENGQRVLDKIVSFIGVAPMDDPRYIILVALDTPSRETGLYISGGVMAAPTVGAVMADILPYLQVTPAEPIQYVQMPQLLGMTPAEAEKALKAAGLEPVLSGAGEQVTDQLPAAGQSLPAASQAVAYLGQPAPKEPVAVPDLVGMTLLQANEAAEKAGLYILARGNPDLSLPLTVAMQTPAAGTLLEPGSPVELTFTDPAARD